MEYIKKIFDKIKIKKHSCIDGEKFLDPIRNFFIQITPEEIVRQRMLKYLMKNLSVPSENILVEEHLAHWGKNFNGRIDIAITYKEKILTVIECKEENIFIESMQVFEQAKNYAEFVGAKYIILVNGVNIQFYHLNEENLYKQIEGILNFSDMIDENFDYEEENFEFQRLDYEDYFDLDFLEEQDWFESIIGDDTPKNLIPCIINFDNCLWDETKKLTSLTSSRFSLLEDLGMKFRHYENASGGVWEGYYRIFLVKNLKFNTEFLIGFAIFSSLKTVNDPKYGNAQGKSVLTICYCDGKIDEMSVQLNLNKFLMADSRNKKAMLIHDGKSGKKGFRKADFIKYVQNKNANLVRYDKFYFGEIDYSVPLTFENSDVINLVSNLIEYAVYRSDYKNSL